MRLSGVPRGAPAPKGGRRPGAGGEPLRANAAAAQRVVHHQDDDRADGGHQNAVEIDAADARVAELIEEPAADDGADDAEEQVPDEPFTAFVDELAADETADDSDDDPGQDRHSRLLGFS